MSGRSAYVRKKITETKGEKGNGHNAARGRAKSVGSSRSSDPDDTATITDQQAMPLGTGYGTTNARFLKFTEPIHEGLIDPPFLNFSNHSSGSQASGSDLGRQQAGTPLQSSLGPMPEYAYARARKPVIKTEDVSGIEKSGFRNVIDKRSDDVRKGLSKAFSFGTKKSRKDSDPRPPSAATTIRPGEEDSGDMPPIPAQQMLMMGGWDGDAMSPPPSTTLPPLPPSAAPAIKRWIGAGRPVQRWNKLRKDPELWDPNGDVLVFYGHKGQMPKPNPSFRLSSHIIEATESRYLITLLREGSTEEDLMMGMPPSPVGGPSPMMMTRPGYGSGSGISGGRGGQPTPPISDDASFAEADGQISYEMYFPTPPTLAKLEAHRHALTTRNIFALLYHASLVGFSLHQALSDLHARLEYYMPPDADNIGTILNYLSARGIDDARNDPETAVSLLAWSESPEVRWEEGWREAFLHAGGMYPRLEQTADFKAITPITRALLERACLETQLRVQAAEERLATFGYDDIWPLAHNSSDTTTSAAHAAADRMQKFFLSYYTRLFGHWPPPASGHLTSEAGEELWLTRTVAQRLQRDFGALYDYLVNREVVWDESEARSSRKWMMVLSSESSSSGPSKASSTFEPDADGLMLTDMLIEWDNKMRFPHIPHPYPLVPESIKPTSSAKEKAPKKEKDKEKAKNDERILERRVQLAYTEATNIYILGSDFTQSDLIDSFVRFEKSDMIGGGQHQMLDPSVARRGRWALIYGVLQTLASVAVDAPSIRYKEDVAYHLSPRLKGTKIPPWRGAAISSQMVEAGHAGSHCWVVPRTWGASGGAGSQTGGESGDDGGMGPTSPVMRMMRAQARAQQMQQQQQGFAMGGGSRPSTAGGGGGGMMSSRSSAAGWQSSGTRSVRSSGAGTSQHHWGSSAMSTVSDDAASIMIGRTPSLVSGSTTRTRSRDGLSSTGSRSVRNYSSNFGSQQSQQQMQYVGGGGGGGMIGRVDEDLSNDESVMGEWPVRAQSRRGVGAQPPMLPSIKGHGGGFLNLEEEEEQQQQQQQGEMMGRRRADKSRGREGGGDGMAPVIRDFDVLDVIDDHEP